MKFFGAVCFWLAAVAAPLGSALAADRNTVQWDPAIRRGVLANGLRFAVMHNATPTGGVSIRLGIDVGSFEETDEERGAAHFVEHMAFGRTHALPGVDLDGAFAGAGVAFGRDRNADTSPWATVYRIDLPRSDDKARDLALRWLRFVADGAEFAADAVAKERGVILAERAQSLSAAEATRRAVVNFQGRGLRSTVREPIGVPETLAAMTPDRLRAFYQRWYRPENAVVVVVGDEPVEALEHRVMATFGSWTAQGPTGVREPLTGAPVPAGLDVLVREEPTILPQVSVCRVQPTSGPQATDDVALRRRDNLTLIWRTIMDARLAAITSGAAAPMIAASSESTWTPDHTARCILASERADQWPNALAALHIQLQRVSDGAPSEFELEDALKALRSKRRGAVGSISTRHSAGLANDLVDAVLDKTVVASPVEAFRAFDAAVADITPADVQAAFVRDWVGSGPLITVISPSPVTRDTVLAAWRLTPSPPAVAAATAPAVWAYQDFGRPGRVVRREVIPVGDYVTSRFANGVIFRFKHTDFEQDQLRVSVVFGAGQRELPDQDRVEAELGDLFLREGGLGKHDFPVIKALFAERTWGAQLAVASHAFVLHGEARTDSLEMELRLLAAYVTDPGFRDQQAKMSALTAVLARSYASNLGMAVSGALTAAVDPGGPHNLPSPAALAGWRATDLERLLRPALTQAPLAVSIVGAIDEKTATGLVAATFGALPARSTATRARPNVRFLRFPDHAPPPILAPYEAGPEKAAIALFWPLYVATPERRREEFALNLAALVLSDALRRRLRDDLGKTYDPLVNAIMPDLADQGYIEALVQVAPADLDLTRREVDAVAAKVARGDFTDAEIETARGPRLAEMAAAERTNSYWDGALRAINWWPGAVDEVQASQGLYRSILPAEVRKAASDWLSRSPIVVIAKPAAPVVGASK